MSHLVLEYSEGLDGKTGVTEESDVAKAHDGREVALIGEYRPRCGLRMFIVNCDDGAEVRAYGEELVVVP